MDIIITAPKMVGLPFFIQRIGLKIFNIPAENLSCSDFIKSVVIKKTDDLEKKWNYGC